MIITVNLEKARIISHDKRRAARAEEFAPLDQQIALQIPGVDSASIGTQRQAIRDKYAAIQVQIDKAADIDALAGILINLGDNGIEK